MASKGLKVVGLWPSKSIEGGFNGTLKNTDFVQLPEAFAQFEGWSLTLFPNKRKKSNREPDYSLYLYPPYNPEEKTETTGAPAEVANKPAQVNLAPKSEAKLPFKKYSKKD